MLKPLIELRRGDTRYLPFQIVDEDGDPMPLSGASLFFTIKVRASDEDEDAIAMKTIGDGITVLEESEGLIQVKIEPEDTSAFTVTKRGLLWDLQHISAGGDVTSLQDGVMNVYMDITRTTTG